ncbi:hypothetical protein CMQ_4494 [Grosmannia clavigera kw1407]|uniref:Uncharacterized protein n=1 Tax=Grosmannia clavigera (strain kw1407 / UAMH 11150) TaxID=655863 RepID=F0XU05_GROCL|nr:uncharacterized protein CMQ_4494 [Grosmannia clavigera kw1407]EFW98642.1 hypothetical protein CMQ_4494 [Grosmannia clavigera kw1407]
MPTGLGEKAGGLSSQLTAKVRLPEHLSRQRKPSVACTRISARSPASSAMHGPGLALRRT